MPTTARRARPARPTHRPRLLVDGTNLLHALSRRPGAAPAAALIGRLRGAIPAAVAIELVFDGPPERGLRDERIASGLTVRYGGQRTADAVILGLVDEARGRSMAPTGRGRVAGRDRRPRPAPRRPAARRPDGRLGVAARAAGSRASCRRRRSGTRDRPAALARSAPATPDRRDRPRRPARLEAGPRRDDQARQPEAGAARRVGLVGCGREPRRRAERDLDPDPQRHGDLRDARLGVRHRLLPILVLLGLVGAVPDRPDARDRRSTWSRKPRVKMASRRARASPRSDPAASRSSRSACPTAVVTGWSIRPARTRCERCHDELVGHLPDVLRWAARRRSTRAPTAASS